MRAKIISEFSGGILSAPPSKSMAHRALLCAALATGVSRITGIAPSEDMRATMRAMACLGAVITYDEASHTATVCGAMAGAAQAQTVREAVPQLHGDAHRAHVADSAQSAGNVHTTDGAHATDNAHADDATHALAGANCVHPAPPIPALQQEAHASHSADNVRINRNAQTTDSAHALAGADCVHPEPPQCPTPPPQSQQASPAQECAPIFPPVQTEVDCGESGSTLRFVIPLFSLTNAPVTLVGHGRLPSRPQGVYADLFAARGLTFAQTARGVYLDGALTAGDYRIDGSVSSQFISGLLFALPLLHGDSVLRVTPPFESRSYVLLTLQVLADFGVCAQWLDENTICIASGQKYKACDYAVEGDCSQAAFFAVLAACLPQSANAALTLTNLRADTQQGDRVIFDILQRCGARLTQHADGSVRVLPSREVLRGVEIDLADCPDLGPVLMVLGLFCAGETVIRNAGRLRVKESDRIAAMEEEIRKIGGDIRSAGDTVFLRGKNTGEERREQKESAWETGGDVSAALACERDSDAKHPNANSLPSCGLHPSARLTGHGDHRIVMAMAVAAAAAGFSGACEIDGAQAINKSYPAFFSDLSALGGRVELLYI